MSQRPVSVLVCVERADCLAKNCDEKTEIFSVLSTSVDCLLSEKKLGYIQRIDSAPCYS